MFEAGHIVVIPFPFSDLSTTKRRPVLVLTAPDNHQDFVCLSVTSKGYHAASVAIADPDMKIGHLPKASWIRTDKVFTLSADQVVKSVGQVRAAILEAAIQNLCDTLKP